jgi:hypothetical protein
MYDLPDNFNPVVFEGGCLEKISFGVGTIHLDFELNPMLTPGNSKPASIVSLSYVKLRLQDVEYKIAVGEYADIAKLGLLLNESVTKATLLGRRKIILNFGEDRAIELEEDGSGLNAMKFIFPVLVKFMSNPHRQACIRDAQPGSQEGLRE